MRGCITWARILAGKGSHQPQSVRKQNVAFTNLIRISVDRGRFILVVTKHASDREIGGQNSHIKSRFVLAIVQ